jgi:hypothetical protein
LPILKKHFSNQILVKCSQKLKWAIKVHANIEDDRNSKKVMIWTSFVVSTLICLHLPANSQTFFLIDLHLLNIVLVSLFLLFLILILYSKAAMLRTLSVANLHFRIHLLQGSPRWILMCLMVFEASRKVLPALLILDQVLLFVLNKFWIIVS